MKTGLLKHSMKSILGLLICGLIVFATSCENNTQPEQVKYTSIAGTLTDSQMLLVPNAIIQIVETSKNPAIADDKVLSSDTTDENGNFSLDKVPSNSSTVEVLIKHPLYQDFRTTVKTLLGQQGIDATKIPMKVQGRDECCGSLPVSVTDNTTNNALSGVEVRISSTAGVLLKKAKTSDLGSFSFMNMCSSEYRIRLSKDGYSVLENNVTVGQNCDSTRHNYKLSATIASDTCTKGRIYVNVNDSSGGATLTGAIVYLSKDGMTTKYQKVGTGTVGFDGLAPGKYHIKIVKEGYSPNPLEADVTIDCNGTSTTSYLLGKNPPPPDCACKLPLTIFVRDSLQNILTGAKIQFRKNGANVGNPYTVGTGAVKTDSLCAPGTYNLLITLDQYTSIEQNVTIDCDTISKTNVQLVMHKPPKPDCPCKGALHMAVLDSALQTALNGATVKLLNYPSNTVAGTGTFTGDTLKFDSICTGAYRLVVTKDGYKGSDNIIIQIDCGKLTSKIVYLPKVQTCCQGIVSFAALDSLDNSQIKGFRVNIYKGDVLLHYKLDNSTGIVLDTLCEGTYSVQYQSEKYQKSINIQFTVTCNGLTPVSKKLSKIDTGCCKGTFGVYNLDTLTNKAVSGIKITGTLSQNGVVVKTSYSDNGYFAFDPVCAGKYTLTLSSDKLYKQTFEVEVVCSTTSKKIAYWNLPKTDSCCKGSLQVNLYDYKTQGSLKGVSVQLRQGSAIIATKASGDATFVVFEKYCAGDYTLAVTKDGYTGQDGIKVTITCDTINYANVYLKPKDSCCKGVIKLILLDTAGGKETKLQNVLVTCKQNGIQYFANYTNGDGVVSSDMLCEGKYTFYFTKDGYKTAAIEATVTCNQTTTVTYALIKNSTDCCKGNVKITCLDSITQAKVTSGKVYLAIGDKITDSTTISGDGVASFTGRCEGTYNFRIFGNDHQDYNLYGVVVSCNQTTEKTVLLKPALCHNSTIKWTVRQDPDTASAIPGATITLKLNGNTIYTGKTNNDGVLSPTSLFYEGSYSCTITMDGFKAQTFDLKVGCGEAINIKKYLSK